MTDEPAELGVIGLGVMGRNLALNFVDHGTTVAAHDIEAAKVAAVVSESGGAVRGTRSLGELVSCLRRPRKVLIMVDAGKPVDRVLDALHGLLERGDVVIDGGNSFYEDTERREHGCAEAGLCFFGVGISGGEAGARHGPALMAGGPSAAYASIAPMLTSIAARSDSGPCIAYLGPGGAGHFVKMVHNGVEYAEMQLIAEVYHVLASVGGLGPEELARVFGAWNQGPLASYLIEITARIFEVRDPDGGGFLIDAVLDDAGQKGTGRWAVRVALEHGVAVPSIAAAVDARVLSSLKSERTRAARALSGPASTRAADVPALVSDAHDALYAARVITYAQGLSLITRLAQRNAWPIDPGAVARTWKAGCIIRARLLDGVMRAYADDPALPSLLLDPDLRSELERVLRGCRDFVGTALQTGIPVPALSSAVAYFDGYRTPRLPQNLTQAQRDAFGAHGYRRIDDDATVSRHTEWLD